MLGIIVVSPSGDSPAIAVCVQPDHDVPKDPTTPLDHAWLRIQTRVSAPSSASGTRKSTSPSERKHPRQSWLTTTYPRDANHRHWPSVASVSVLLYGVRWSSVGLGASMGRPARAGR